MDEEDYNFYVVNKERNFSYAIWDNQSNMTKTSKELSIDSNTRVSVPLII